MVIAGDVGVTKTDLAIYSIESGPWEQPLIRTTQANYGEQLSKCRHPFWQARRINCLNKHEK